MRILEMVGHVLRPFHSSEAKLIEKDAAVASYGPSITIESNAFTNGGDIPIEYTAYGVNRFPKLSWSNLPAGCISVVLVIEDPDAPKVNPFLHGIVYNIPAALTGLPAEALVEGKLSSSFVEQGLRLGNNSMGQPTYLSPVPPPGHGPHHYHFQVIALDTMLQPLQDESLPGLKAAITGHVLGFGELVGVFEK